MVRLLRDSPDGLLGVERHVVGSRVKITVPSLPSGFVARAELCAGLDAAAGGGGWSVPRPGTGRRCCSRTGPARAPGVDTAWVGVDRDDNDPGRLWAAVVAAIAGCPSVPRASRLHGRWAWRAGAQPEFLGELAEAVQALPQPLRLILDDVHELVDPVALHGVQILTRIKPASLQLVLSSRFDPPLSLPRLRLQGRLRELRAAQLAFTPAQAAQLLEQSGLRLSPQQVEVLHRRTGGWVAGLRLAARAVEQSADREALLTHFSGDDRSVADYLVGEILSGLPEAAQEFLRVISICDLVPIGLAAALSEREDAGSVLDRLERETSLVTTTGRAREAYRVQELLRTHLLADLQRRGPRRPAELHAVAARWWADQDEPVRALEHAAAGRDRALLIELLHRFAIPLILAGHHGPLRRALARVGASTTATDPWLALSSALAHFEAGELPAVQADLRHARQAWPADGTADGTGGSHSAACRRRAARRRPARPTSGPGRRPGPVRDRGTRRAARRTGAGGAGPSEPGRRRPRTRRPGRRPRRTRRRAHPEPPPRLRLPDPAMPRAARRRRRHLRGRARDARGQQRGPRRRRRPRLADHHLVGRRHRDAGLHRAPAVRGRRCPTPHRRRAGLGGVRVAAAAVRAAGRPRCRGLRPG